MLLHRGKGIDQKGQPDIVKVDPKGRRILGDTTIMEWCRETSSRRPTTPESCSFMVLFLSAQPSGCDHNDCRELVKQTCSWHARTMLHQAIKPNLTPAVTRTE